METPEQGILDSRDTWYCHVFQQEVEKTVEGECPKCGVRIIFHASVRSSRKYRSVAERTGIYLGDLRDV